MYASRAAHPAAARVSSAVLTIPDPVSMSASPAPVRSPCIQVCRMDPQSNVCRGCLRTLDEIAGWSGYSDDEKREVLALVRERRTGIPRQA